MCSLLFCVSIVAGKAKPCYLHQSEAFYRVLNANVVVFVFDTCVVCCYDSVPVFYSFFQPKMRVDITDELEYAQ